MVDDPVLVCVEREREAVHLALAVAKMVRIYMRVGELSDAPSMKATQSNR